MSLFDNLTYDVLNEAIKPFDPKDFNTIPASQPVSMIIGRFSPWTRGHNALLDGAKHPVVIIVVKGAKSSLDKDKNPFLFEQQKEIILAAKNPKIKDVIELDNASIPNIISKLRDMDYEPKELWCGTDRFTGYKIQIDKYANQLNADIKIKMLVRNEDDADVAGISATKVREAIKTNNYQSAHNMMVNLTPQLFSKLYRQMLKI